MGGQTLRFLLRAALLPALLVVVSALGPTSPAEAGHGSCNLKIFNLKHVEFRGHDGSGYEVFDDDQHAELITFTVKRLSGSCSFVVGLTAGGGGSYEHRRLRAGAKTLQYQLYRDVGASEVLKDLPLAEESNVLSGTLGPGDDSLTFQAYFIIPMQQVVPPARYRDTVVVKLYEGSLLSAQLRDQEQLHLSARVPATAEFGFGDLHAFNDAVRNACLDFGELRTGAARQLTLRARSNAGYRITMRSQNRGEMRTSPSRHHGDSVPYRLTIDGRDVSLRRHHPVTAVTYPGQTSEAGNAHSLTFTIGDVATVCAGNYSDVIEVTLYPAK